MSRSYNTIFKNVKALDTLHHFFTAYYDHFDGDVKACLSFYNSYLSRQVAILEDRATKQDRKAKVYDGGIFHRKEVVSFLQRFDNQCKEGIISVLSDFNNHSDLIIFTPIMDEFIKEAPAVFGDMWDLMCDLRGIKPNYKREKDRMDNKLHSVLSKTLRMARIANQKTLKYWAMISNISSFAHGVGRKA